MGMEKHHLVVIGDPRKMTEVPGRGAQLVLTSPPRFDGGSCANCSGQAEAFGNYLRNIQLVFDECHRALGDGRFMCVNVCEPLNHSCKCPAPAHFVILLQRAGFDYRDNIVWRKPSQSSPNLGHILVMRKGRPDFRKVPQKERLQAIFDIRQAMRGWDWRSPSLPESICEILIKLYTLEGETVLDPFLGDGATTRAAAGLNRSSIGYTLDYSALSSLRRSSGIAPHELEVIEKGVF
jgi:site-specific DNA-methyltransferase (adenine-specific)